MSAINYFKLVIRGEPFYPVDASISGEAVNILSKTNLNWPVSLWLFGIVASILVVFTWFLKDPPLLNKIRYPLLGAFMILVGASYPVYFANSKNQASIGITDTKWAQGQNYMSNGLVNTFLMQVRYMIIDRPSGYSSKEASRILEDTPAVDGSGEKKPNIIVVMNESYWDPTRLPNVSYNVDIMKDFRTLQAESIHGDLLVHPFGGHTANTEFEVLTGFSMDFLPTGVSAYQQYYKKPLPSLPLLLGDQGYSRVAIHPFSPEFWNRDVVYPMMGIDDFISIESFNDPGLERFVPDESVVDKLIRHYDANKKIDVPYFAHIVTMQNHGSYLEGRYGQDQEVVAESSRLSGSDKVALEVYAQGVKDANSALVRLIDHFRQIDEPTIVVFFGDHLPSLGEDYGVYRKTGYIDTNGLSDDNYLKLRQVPFLVWSNTQSEAIDMGTINDYYLTPIILKQAQLSMNDYFSFMYNNIKLAPACSMSKCLQNDGSYKVMANDEFTRFLSDKQKLQYYFMFDK